LTAALKQLKAYYEKYKERLSGKNTCYIQQIILICHNLLHLNSFHEDKENSNSLMCTVHEFVSILKIDHINLFKLIKFMEESKLANKMHGFALDFAESASKADIQSNDTNEEDMYIIKHSSPLLQIQQLINSIATPDADGRILIAKGNILSQRI
jgi:chromosome transmission fidelity protein 1